MSIHELFFDYNYILGDIQGVDIIIYTYTCMSILEHSPLYMK